MKRILLFLIAFFSYFFLVVSGAMAAVDPLAVKNNKIGVHILSPDEIEDASYLVNGDGGEWGYVVVPIQSKDRDRRRWKSFMQRAAELKVIPIIRVATLVEEVNWEEPNNFDLVDFANFLNDLPWPTKNRYVVVFNEVNRADEYGGWVAPERYAQILVNAQKIFKERSEDFFILPAGLDNAAGNTDKSIKWSEYLRRMNDERPGVFGLLDGWTSHSYPNYAFVGGADERHDHSVFSWWHEINLVEKYAGKRLPVFITETGWDMERLGEEVVAQNFRRAIERAWSDERVVMVSPFLLRAGEGPFRKFSLVRADGLPTSAYRVWKGLATKGEPVLAGPMAVGGAVVGEGEGGVWFGLKGFDWEGVVRWWEEWWKAITVLLEPRQRVEIGGRVWRVEVADEVHERVKGLSGRSSLGEGEGMLFVFEPAQQASFWMRGMRFDLDLIWIKEEKVVAVDRAEKDSKKVYTPEVAVDYVLEVGVDSGVEVGERVSVVR